MRIDEIKDFPLNLYHKPAIGIPGYKQIDGQYAGDPADDTEAISIGYPAHPDWYDGVSGKVWRVDKNGNASIQAEGLPMHRIIDLTTLISMYFAGFPTINNRLSSFINDGTCVIPEIVDEDIFREFAARLSGDERDRLLARLSHLKSVLNSIEGI